MQTILIGQPIRMAMTCMGGNCFGRETTPQSSHATTGSKQLEIPIGLLFVYTGREKSAQIFFWLPCSRQYSGFLCCGRYICNCHCQQGLMDKLVAGVSPVWESLRLVAHLRQTPLCVCVCVCVSVNSICLRPVCVCLYMNFVFPLL